jgi:hypothetical protein
LDDDCEAIERHSSSPASRILVLPSGFLRKLEGP